jgi:hypothetical protein
MSSQPAFHIAHNEVTGADFKIPFNPSMNNNAPPPVNNAPNNNASNNNPPPPVNREKKDLLERMKLNRVNEQIKYYEEFIDGLKKINIQYDEFIKKNNEKIKEIEKEIQLLWNNESKRNQIMDHAIKQISRHINNREELKHKMASLQPNLESIIRKLESRILIINSTREKKYIIGLIKSLNQKNISEADYNYIIENNLQNGGSKSKKSRKTRKQKKSQRK